MQSRRAGAIFAIVALVAAVGLFVVLREDDDPAPETTPPAAQEEEAPDPDEPPAAEPQEPEEPEVETVVLRDGEPVDGVAELSFRRGEQIEFFVRSNTDEELHLHGYDVVRRVEAGGRARFNVEAEFEGVFEVETHPGHVPVAEVAVGP